MSWLDRLIARASAREPDFVIGPKADPYMRRWWVIPRNRFFNIYLHNIRKSDDDRALHDHPWINVSILLRGNYVEFSPQSTDKGRRRFRGDVVFRWPTTLHRLLIDDDQVTVWSLFITGPVVRVWGFACPKGWIPWFDFVEARDKGQIGKGCD